jgi:hypothetical protein
MGAGSIPRGEPSGEGLVGPLDEYLTRRAQMIIQMLDPKMRHLNMPDEDWETAMEDLFDTLRKLPPEYKAEAYDVVERCLFKGESDT